MKAMPALMLGILLLVACTQQRNISPVQTTIQALSTSTTINLTRLELELGKDLLVVSNSGTNPVQDVKLFLKSYFIEHIFNGSREDSIARELNIESLTPGTEREVGITECIPPQKRQVKRYNLYRCEVVLYGEGKEFAKQELFLSYKQGLNPWEEEIYLIEGKDYELFRQGVQQQYEQLKAAGKI